MLLREQPVLSLLDGTVPQPDDGGCLQACDDRHLHCKRVPADARNSQAPDHCGHNNPPTYPSKEEQRRSCFSNQERKVENLHEWAIEVKAVDSYHWQGNDFHMVSCDECLNVGDVLRTTPAAVLNHQSRSIEPTGNPFGQCFRYLCCPEGPLSATVTLQSWVPI